MLICFWTVVLEKTLESLTCKESKPVNPKRNQPWIFIERTDTEAPISSCLQSFPDAGKDWRREKRMTENEMVGWHHRFNRHEFAQILGDSEGQGSLACCSPWGHKESDTTKWLNSNNKCIVNAMFCVKWVIFFNQHLYLQAANSLSKIRVYYKATLNNVMGKEGRDKYRWQGHVVSYFCFSVFWFHPLFFSGKLLLPIHAFESHGLN